MPSKNVIVYGGKGALGAAILDFFKKQNFGVYSIDMVANDQADGNIIVKTDHTWEQQEEHVLSQAAEIFKTEKVDGIFCVAGGWDGGSTKSSRFITNSDRMIKQSVWSSAIAAKLANQFLKPGGLLQLTGAAAALEATPGMIGYGMAKAAVHHLGISLAAENSGMPDGSTVVMILPVTLDTPMNRKSMPNADFKTWLPLSFISEKLHLWVEDPKTRPHSGDLLKFDVVDNTAQVIPYKTEVKKCSM